METQATDVRELRNRLLDAGRTVFARCGYAGATVDDVIEEASTSRATFYRYFRSKEDLFTELSRVCFHEIRDIFGDVSEVGSDGDTAEQLQDLLMRYRDMHARHGGVFRAWWERTSRPSAELRADAASTFGTFVESLARPISAADVPSSVDIEVQAALLYLLIERSYFAVSGRWSRIDPDELAPTLATMIHRAYFGGPPPKRAGRLRIGER
jgi:AcrR family transcriptional regulator